LNNHRHQLLSRLKPLTLNNHRHQLLSRLKPLT
jgi:hypothetical protein